MTTEAKKTVLDTPCRTRLEFGGIRLGCDPGGAKIEILPCLIRKMNHDGRVWEIIHAGDIVTIRTIVDAFPSSCERGTTARLKITAADRDDVLGYLFFLAAIVGFGETTDGQKQMTFQAVTDPSQKGDFTIGVAMSEFDLNFA